MERGRPSAPTISILNPLGDCKMITSNSLLIRSCRSTLGFGVAFSILVFTGCEGVIGPDDQLAEDQLPPAVGWQSMHFPHFGHVVALTIYDGDLIVGGAFAAGNRIARWDGSDWHPMGTGTNDAVMAFTIFEGDLIAGGHFTKAGEQTANSVARWDGTVWHPMGAGITGNASVNSLAVYEGHLIAAGGFKTVGGQEANNVARWTGSEWQPMGTGIEHTVLALAVHDGALIAGGSGFSRWDGSDWTSTGTASSPVHAFISHDDALIAGGHINAAAVARWNGSTWQPVGTGTREYANAFAVYDGDLIAGGDFPFTFGAGTNHIARWDGTTWQPMGAGMDADVSALAVYNGDLIAGGGFMTAGGNNGRFLARWGAP
jgi:hypothetical protein